MFPTLRGTCRSRTVSAPSSFLSRGPILRWGLAGVLGLLSALNGAPAWAAADVNKAALEELRTVKGIGPGIAGRILEERKRGGFKDWADFIGRVKGIGEGNAAKFSGNGLTVNGAAYAAVAGTAPMAAASQSSSRGRQP